MKLLRKGIRFLEPEFCKHRELLHLSRNKGVQGQPPGAHPILEILRNGPEIRGPEKHTQLIQNPGLIQGIMHAEPRIAPRLGKFFRKNIFSVIKEFRGIADGLIRAVRQNKHLHQPVEDIAGVKKSNLKRRPFRTPKTPIILPADIPVLVIIQPKELRSDIHQRFRLVGGFFLRHAHNVRKSELRLPPRLDHNQKKNPRDQPE